MAKEFQRIFNLFGRAISETFEEALTFNDSTFKCDPVTYLSKDSITTDILNQTNSSLKEHSYCPKVHWTVSSLQVFKLTASH